MTLREHGLTRTATAEERINEHASWFDADVDPATTLVPLIKRLGLNLERIVGKEKTAEAFAVLTGGEDDWREEVAETDFYLMSELGQALSDLSLYAVFGVSGYSSIQDEKIQHTLQTIEDLLLDCQADRWLPDVEREPLLPVVRMARARWNLDHGEGLEAEGLALLGGVKLSRIRNMMSGHTPELPKDVIGLISNEAARSWLDKRDCFLPTIVSSEDGYTEMQSAEINPIFIPVARDGSMFTPNLKRNGGYQIGEKGAEEKVSSYDDALTRLQAMPTAKWRRPNENDNWGIVAAIEWRRVDRNSL
jgi:hypothetical protein